MSRSFQINQLLIFSKDYHFLNKPNDLLLAAKHIALNISRGISPDWQMVLAKLHSKWAGTFQTRHLLDFADLQIPLENVYLYSTIVWYYWPCSFKIICLNRWINLLKCSVNSLIGKRKSCKRHQLLWVYKSVKVLRLCIKKQTTLFR